MVIQERHDDRSLCFRFGIRKRSEDLTSSCRISIIVIASPIVIEVCAVSICKCSRAKCELDKGQDVQICVFMTCLLDEGDDCGDDIHARCISYVLLV